MSFSRILRTLCFLLALAPSGPLGRAQTVDAALRGRVLDPSDGAVAGARLTLSDPGVGSARSTRSAADGSYAIAELPPGRYDLEVQADGFKTLKREGIVLNVGETRREDARLEIGEISEEVAVTARVDLLRVEGAAVGAVIPNNYIVDLPLDGRNFLELALLVSGTAPAAVGSAGSSRGRLAIHAAGAREDSNAFVYDGVYAIDPVLNSFTFTPPVDAIREFRVETANVEAGRGRNSGAQVSVSLKRGENEVHGTVYEFFRNDSLDARNFFDPPDRPTPKLRRNQFGFSLGGPIAKNRTFFFGDFEGLRERRAETRVTNVPTAAERQGDFSGSALPTPIDFFTGQPFPNNRLPFLHPSGQAIAGLFPLPNRSDPGRNFVSSPGGRDDTDKFDVRVDHRLGENGALGVRYSFADRDRFEPFATGQSSEIPGFGNDVDERGQNLMVSETHAFGARWVNEARFGYNRVDNRTFHENSGVSINQQVGLPDFATRPRDLGLSFIETTGFSPLGGEINNPQDGGIESFQISDAAALSSGSHLVEFGFEQRWIRGTAFRDILSRGQIGFTDAAFTQSALADLLLGLPTFTGGGVSDNEQNQRTWATNLFVHDSWRARPNLTLTLGLRYEFVKPAFDKFDAASVFDPASASIVRVGTGGVPRGGFRDDRNNFAPRVGLAWSPGGSRSTVVRAGYGIHYNQSALAPGQGIFFNQPFFNLLLFLPSARSQITLSDPFPSGGAAPLPPSALTFDRALRTSYAQNWNVAIQRELGAEWVFSLGYVGTQGVKLLGARDVNQAGPSAEPLNLRPLPTFQSIDQIESSFNSIYHSLQASLQRRFRDGLTGLFSYTFSKSIDNASGFFPSAGDANFPQDSRNTSLERGRSSFDAPHRFVGSFAYELPFGPGKRWASGAGGAASRLLGGWKANGVVVLQSGRPFTVFLPSALDNSNTGRSSLGFGANDRPNVVGDPSLADPDPALWINPAAFSMPAFGTFGDAGRGIVDGPGLSTVNFSLLKDTRLGERTKLQFRAEFFNLFNRPNFENPNVFFGTPGFGRILAAGAGREMQFGLKLLF